MVYVYCPVVHQMFTLCPQNHVMLHLLSLPSKHNTAQTLSPFSTTVQLCIALPRHQLTRTTRTSGQCVGTFSSFNILFHAVIIVIIIIIIQMLCLSFHSSCLPFSPIFFFCLILVSLPLYTNLSVSLSFCPFFNLVCYSVSSVTLQNQPNLCS